MGGGLGLLHLKSKQMLFYAYTWIACETKLEQTILLLDSELGFIAAVKLSDTNCRNLMNDSSTI